MKKKLTEREKWALYESEKKKLQNIGLTPREYMDAIRALCDRIGY